LIFRLPVTLLTGGGQTACVAPPSGMVAWYPLDEQSGVGIVYDVADWDDNGNTLDANGSPTTISATPGPTAGPVPVTSPPLNLASGKVGSALYFYGPYLEVPLPATDLNFGKGDLSIDAWIWPVQVGQGLIQPIVDRLDLTNQKGYAFYVEDGLLRFRMGNGTFAGATSTGSVTYGTWNHVAVTVNRSDPLSGVKFYINGAPSGFGPPVSGNSDSAQAVWIGKSRLSPPAGFGEIAIDELEIFNRVLSPQEIQSIFQVDKEGKCKSDLGDAPDSTNHPGQTMLAYPSGPSANFPTVYLPSAPHGPFHHNATGDAWLGQAVTLEGEADQGWDQDLSTLGNNINPPTIANRDDKDDGVSPINIPVGCSPQTLTYSVTVIGPNTPRYVNVWFDFNADGDWQDTIPCGPIPPAREWAVQNHQITLGPGFHSGLVTPSFVAFRDPNKPPQMWMRVTLTNVPVAAVNGADGSGPSAGYPFGETEDYLLRFEETKKCDLAIGKSLAHGIIPPLQPGQQVTFEIVVTNVGTGPCDPLIPVTETFTGMTYQSGGQIMGPWTCPPGPSTTPVTCNYSGTLQPGQSSNFFVTFTVDAKPGDAVENCAEVKHPNDTNPANNKSCVTITVTGGVCDREIKKTVTPNPVKSGDPVIITLTVTNVGTAPCPVVPGINVADPQPSGLTFQPPVSANNPGWSCGFSGPGVIAFCTATSPLLPGAANAVTITFTAKVTAPPGSQIQNCAEVTNVGDAVQTNNKSCVTINVIGLPPPPDLALAKLLDGQLRVEQEATYVLRVTNGGGGPTSGPIVVSDPLPSGLRFVSASGPGWSCSAEGQNVTCRNAGPIQPGQTSTILLRVRVAAPAGTQITNCATVETAGDANPANNRACHTGTVQR